MHNFKIGKLLLLMRILFIIVVFNAFVFFIGFVKNYIDSKLLLANFHLLILLLITGYSPVYTFKIDMEKQVIIFQYFFLYFIKKQQTLTFEQFDFRYDYGAPFISLGGYEVNIYFKKHSIVTLNTKFGWKKKVLKEIIEILEEIKPPKPRLLDKK